MKLEGNLRIMKYLKAALVLLLVLVIGVGIFISSGIYNVGADSPHWKITYALMKATREHSIERHADEISLPANLNDAQLILKGAGQYAAMCTSCHLAPGINNSELRIGLYPQPPNLSKVIVNPTEAFWVIKHGLKMSAMPAWGMSHDDATIWSMVAFLQKMPEMTPEQYKEIVAKAPPDEDMDSMGNAAKPTPNGHSHDSHTHTSK
jgi:mono/diheme cytochrome c family protein